MNERDFVYWAQGYFELTGNCDLTPEQFEMIHNHVRLSLVESPHSPLLTKWNVVLDYVLSLDEHTETLRNKFAEEMAANINDHFLHVIDPVDGPPVQQAFLNELHTGPLRPSGPQMRC